MVPGCAWALRKSNENIDSITTVKWEPKTLEVCKDARRKPSRSAWLKSPQLGVPFGDNSDAGSMKFMMPRKHS